MMLYKRFSRIYMILMIFLMLGAVTPANCKANGLPVNMSGDFWGLLFRPSILRWELSPKSFQ